MWLISARAVQGLGAALVSPAALSIVTTTFAEGAERNKALGVWGAVAGSGGAAGVLLGGMLTEWPGWEWVLFVNVPIGIVAALLAPRLLAESRDIDRVAPLRRRRRVHRDRRPRDRRLRAGRRQRRRLDLDADARRSARSRSRCSPSSSAVELRSPSPLVPFSIFRLRSLRGSNIVGLLIGMSLFSMFFFISLYLQQVLGYSALKAGFAYLPLALAIIFSAGAASQLVTRIGFKPSLILGMVFIAAGPAVVLAGLAGRHLPGRRPVPVDPRRDRPRLLVRPGDDRRGHGHQAAGGRARLGADQHLPAGRRRARPGDPVVDRHQPDQQRARPAAAGDATALTEGFQTAFLVGAGFAVTGAILAAVLISSRDSREQVAAARAARSRWFRLPA